MENTQLFENQVKKYFKLCAMKIHIGDRIKEVAAKRKKSIAELANDVNTGRRNMYTLLTKDDMLISQLWDISQSLDYNFFREYFPVNSKIEEIRSVEEDALLEAGAEYGEEKVKKKGKEITVNVAIKYNVNDPDNLGIFIRSMNKIAEKLGVKLI